MFWFFNTLRAEPGRAGLTRHTVVEKVYLHPNKIIFVYDVNPRSFTLKLFTFTSFEFDYEREEFEIL